MTLKLITFDLDDTLWPVTPVLQRAEKAGQDWLAEYHPEIAARHTPHTLLALRTETLKANPALVHNLTALRKTALEKLFTDAGFSAAEARQQADKAFSVFHEVRNQVVLFPQVREVLEGLAETYLLGALTNGNADLKRIGLGDLFAFQHSAESIGRRKPAPDMFQAALRSVNAKPAETLHIGDHPHEDVQAARDHGWSAIWANLLARDWPEELAPPAATLEQWSSLPTLIAKHRED